jgi:hypothetical protein
MAALARLHGQKNGGDLPRRFGLQLIADITAAA